MQHMGMDIRVFHIPGGERASLSAYEKLSKLLETHIDVSLTVYHGQNRYDGTWSLVLLSEKISLTHYQEQIQRILSDVQAQPLLVPPESLTPFVEKFLAAQTEMRLRKTSFLMKHHPRQKSTRRPKRRKR